MHGGAGTAPPPRAYVEYGEECSQCGGTGTADPTDEELDEWLEEAQGAIIDALSNCPL